MFWHGYMPKVWCLQWRMSPTCLTRIRWDKLRDRHHHITLAKQLLVGCLWLQVGARVEQEDAYPGWQPDPGSAVLQLTREVLAELTGAPPKVGAIHAGLECGILGAKVRSPVWCCVSAP